MTDIFRSEDAVRILRGKTVLFLGGSVTRGLYKDTIWLLNSNTLIQRNILGQKGEDRFPDFSNVNPAENEEERFKYKDRLHDCKGCPEDYKGANTTR